jgi:uncharacterized protein YhbP (UPF0306 family)
MSELQIDILIKKYLSKSRMMQIATVDNGQPWICTVYYVEDEDLNLYWLSLPTRRHSQEIEKHNKIAIAVPVKFDKPVVGIQAEGTAEAIKSAGEIANNFMTILLREKMSTGCIGLRQKVLYYLMK